VIFDVDGTLLDTREFILAAFEHTLIEFGITAPARNTLSVMMGPPLKSIYAQIAPGIEFDNLARAPQFSTQKFCTHFAISRSAGTFAVPKIPRNKGGFL
jgi:phosphoglycolate phosphatase-like HAD superfamily hydrolase